MSELDELDRPSPVTREDGVTLIAPADFKPMTPEQLRGWPQRVYVRWRRQQVPLVLVPIGIGIVAGLLYWSWSVGVGVAGLGLDIFGAWLLTKAVIMTDEEAEWFSTHGGLQWRGQIAKRDARQARFALGLLMAGFLGQLFSLLLGQSVPWAAFTWLW
jgi:hypothetical protein